MKYLIIDSRKEALKGSAEQFGVSVEVFLRVINNDKKV